MIKIDDIVLVSDLNGKKYKGRVVSINEFREPSMRYGIDVDGFNDVIFIGEKFIEEVTNEN